MKKTLQASTGLIALMVAACVTSHVLVGKARPPLASDQVHIYLEPIARHYQEIAVLDTSSRYSWSLSADGKTEVVVKRLTDEAAKLGANGILLQEITDSAQGTFATGVGTEHISNHGTISLGFGGEALLSAKFGRGIAVYVDPKTDGK